MAVTTPTQIRIEENTKNMWEFKPEVAEAMEEARRISRDPEVKGYTDMDGLFEELGS